MAKLQAWISNGGFCARLPALGLLAGTLFATTAAAADCAAWSASQGLLSAHAEHCPRKQVLAGLTALAGIRLGSRLPDGDQRLDLRLYRVTPEAAVAEALSGLSYALLPDPAARGSGRKLLLILGGEAIADAEPVLVPADADSDELADRAVHAFDAGERHAALETLTYAGGSVNPSLRQALLDREATVRMRALEMLRDVDGELPTELLAELADHDADRGVRLQALSVLLDKAPGDPVTERVKLSLARDRDTSVANAARQLAGG